MRDLILQLSKSSIYSTKPSEGDMVLKAWALDDASNLLAKTVDPSQLVDIIQKNEIQQRFLADLDI
ncbi:hypothetical protein [Klebsiella pneumoniae]|uniref:hypothetical protein n=1 Tax=Klebsiella pneumoniae TaxID=573 RepID=UPI002165B23B|nr:hypothetical protein [Klebsiella pneumoniae]